MGDKNKSEKLFSEFPEISPEQWFEKVSSDLKGADFIKKLVWKSSEGIDVMPNYMQKDIQNLVQINSLPGNFPFIRGNKTDNNDWKIRQNFKVCSPEKANEKALSALERGASEIGFILSSDTKADQDYLNVLLNDIDISSTPVHFTGIENYPDFYNILITSQENKATDLNSLKGSLGMDPLGMLTLRGEIDVSSFNELSGLIALAANKTPLFKIAGVNPHLFQDGGSGIVQELAFGLSVANEYMDILTSRGIAPAQIMNSLLFTFATGPNYFMEIAKLRAARWLWSLICKEWGIDVDEIKMNIHSQTAKWNLSIYDPYVNVLRSTTEVMSASLGGSDSISVHPHDFAYMEENDFSGRISRNIQTILKEEAYFDKVADPAAGSYYIESLTNNIAGEAWKLFQEIEREDGYLSAFRNGIIQEKISHSLSTRKEQAATRKEGILGVSHYPNFNEMVLNNYMPEVEKEYKGNSAYRPVGQFRIAEEFENLRLQTEKSGKRPKVFLMKYGDPAWMTARAMFAGNFFGCAGYEIIDNHGFESVEEAIKAAKKANSDIVVICSSDQLYPEIGPLVFDALGKKTQIVIAGYPVDSIDDLKAKGLTNFIHMKSRLLEELQKYNNILGIKTIKV